MELAITLIIIAFAVHRVTQFITLDYGPFFCMGRLRDYTDSKRSNAQDRGNQFGVWATIDELLRCPYCAGIYVSFISVLIFTRFSDILTFILYWLAVAGIQSYLQGQEKSR